MLYIVSKEDKVMGTPFIAKDLEEAQQKMIVRSKDKLSELEDIFKHNVNMKTMEIEKQIVACESIIEAEKSEKETTEETKETAKQANKFIKDFKKQVKEITAEVRAEVDVLVDVWTFEVSDLDFYEIAPITL